MIDRRAFIAMAGGSILGGPLWGEAQQPTNVARLGYLVTGVLESRETQVLLDAFRQGLRERGYVEGQNIVIEYRAADGKIERFPALATELAQLKVDLILAVNTPAARAARQATTTIPIVTPIMGDPVGDGLVASLARPGGNVTGLTFLGPELVVKRLELLKEALPKVSRVAGLCHPGAYAESTTRAMLQETEAAARALAVRLQVVRVSGPDELGRAFSTMSMQRAEAITVFPSAMFFNERTRVVDLATRHRLPAMYQAREFVELGGLIAYGASVTDLIRRSATHVDKILKGAKPAYLPVERPTKFELAINLKTAKALGVTIPKTVILQADQIIE